MFFPRCLFNKKSIIFSLLFLISMVFSPAQQVKAVEISLSDRLVASTEKKENTPLLPAEKNTEYTKETMSATPVAEPQTQETQDSQAANPENPEKKTLKLWGMHQENVEISAPVTVSTTNSTLSVLKKAQQHAKLLPLTNSTLLPGLNATIPVTMPPSNMPQIAPVTNW